MPVMFYAYFCILSLCGNKAKPALYTLCLHTSSRWTDDSASTTPKSLCWQYASEHAIYFGSRSTLLSTISGLAVALAFNVDLS